MKTKTSIFSLLIIAMIVLAISPAIASAQASTTHLSGKAAVAEWTVNTNAGPVTITAILSLPQKGPNELTVIVSHPHMGTWTTTVTDFTCKWSMNHASVQATMPFGPRTTLHSISIDWQAITAPAVAHFRGIDPGFGAYAIINQPTAFAIAQITIDDGTPLHPGTYSSDIAAIANIVENIK